MATDAAASAANEIVVTLASHWGWFDVHERVRATCGALVRGPTESSIPIAWLADAGKRILPGVDGVMALTALPESCTDIAFTGRFVPPPGLIGSAGGVVLGRQVAEAALEHLLDQLVFHVEQSEPSPIPPNFKGPFHRQASGDGAELIMLDRNRPQPPSDSPAGPATSTAP